MDKKLKNILLAVTGAILFIFGTVASYKMWEVNDSTDILIVQAVNGHLTVYTDAGIKWQGWGTCYFYKKSSPYWFDGKHAGGTPFPVKFYDGGHANIPGSVRVDLPLSEELMKQIHTKFGSQENLKDQLISQVLGKAITMSGPTMTSKESYAEKKNEFLFYVEDQASNGVYKTTQKEVEITDPLTKQKNIVKAVEIIKDTAGLDVRMEKSLVSELGIKLSNLSFGDFDYDRVVKDQIATQQQATMQVQTAIAKATEAVQQTITIAEQGKQSAAEAEWKQKTINAQVVSEAEGRKLAAEQDAKAEQFNKEANILRGEGEAAYKRLVTQANNNLELKLKTYEDVQGKWADAFSKYQGNVVPTYQTGTGGGSGNGAVQFMEIMGMKAAKDLTVDPKP